MMSEKNPFVSIVVPVYGVEKYVHKCLESVDSQKYPALEVILVNDCTKDNSMQVVEDFINGESSRPDIYRVINHAENKGLSEARNTGIRAAVGDYVYFLDSDDYISCDCIGHLAALAALYDVDVVFGNIARLRNDQTLVSAFNTENRVYARQEILNLYADGILYREAPNKLLRKSYLLEHALFFEPGMLNEDVNWTFRMLAPHFTAALLDEPTYYYVQEREGSIMNTLTMRNYEASIRNLEIIDETIDRQCLRDDIPYIKYYVSMIEFTIWFLFFHKNTFADRKELYGKFRRAGIEYHRYYETVGERKTFANVHLFVDNPVLAFMAFEAYNIWRRVNGRIKHG